MRKKSLAYLLIISLVILMAFASGCSSKSPSDSKTDSGNNTPPAQEQKQEVIKLTASCYLPPAHIFSTMMGDMMKEIQDKSNGRLEITFAPGGSLLTAPKTADGVEQGLADIGFSHIGYNPGRFPVSEALDLPMGYPSSWVGSHVALDYLDKYKPKEWDNFKVLQISGGTTAAVHMAKTPVRKLEDLKGKTLRGAGEVADALKALGATPRDIPMTEVYEGMSKGTIDGILVSSEVLKSFKIADVTKYTTYVPSIGNQYLFYMVMNKDKWNSLPPDIQKIFDEVAPKYQEEVAKTWNKINVEGFELAMSQGVEFITLPDAELARWQAAVQPVLDNYVTKMAGKGFAEQQTKDGLAFIKDRITYWEQQEKSQNIPSEADIKTK